MLTGLCSSKQVLLWPLTLSSCLWLCLFVCVCVCVCGRFRAEIEVVQNDVSELETRLDKVRRMHRTHPHTLWPKKKHITLSHCSTLEKMFPSQCTHTHTHTHTHTQTTTYIQPQTGIGCCWTHAPHVQRQVKWEVGGGDWGNSHLTAKQEVAAGAASPSYCPNRENYY